MPGYREHMQLTGRLTLPPFGFCLAGCWDTANASFTADKESVVSLLGMDKGEYTWKHKFQRGSKFTVDKAEK